MKAKNRITFIFLCFFFVGCDFTPVYQKKILEAQSFIDQGLYREAIRSYEKILKMGISDRTKIQIHYQLAGLYSTFLADHKNSLKHLNAIEGQGLIPEFNKKALEKKADIYFSFQRRYKESALAYRRLIPYEKEKDKRELFEYRLGLSLSKVGKFSAAKKIFSQMSQNQNHTHRVDALYELGLLSFQQKHWKESIEFWRTYIREEDRREKVIEVKFLMANAYETMQELKTAYNLYYSLLGDYPNTAAIKARLENIYKRRVARKR